MSYKVGNKRQETMLRLVGEAAPLIDNKAFLPFYRSIQKKLIAMGQPNEWAKMIEVSKTKDQPSRYFSTLCKMVKAGTYRFVEKVKEVTGQAALYLHDKLVKFGFGKYQKYWVRKAQEFINVNGEVGFVELLEYAERKGISQKYMATALKNCKAPRDYYKTNVMAAR